MQKDSHTEIKPDLTTDVKTQIVSEQGGNPKSKNFTFSKIEHLCSEKVITSLFKEGKNEFLHPFKVFYLYDEAYSQSYPQVLFSIPKRQFKKAVDRNLIRRRSKEAYRLHKNILTACPQKIPAYLGFVYIAKEKLSFQQIEKKIISLLEKITKLKSPSGS